MKIKWHKANIHEDDAFSIDTGELFGWITLSSEYNFYTAFATSFVTRKFDTLENAKRYVEWAAGQRREYDDETIDDIGTILFKKENK